jgi:AcrR family transcriptional regulator
VKHRTYQLRKRAESAEETRRRIVQATFELHGDQGIAATTMKHIAEKAGVSIGTVYHHFPTLDQTVQACGQMVSETFPPPGEEVFAGVAGLRERARLLARALWAHLDRLVWDRIRADQHRLEIVRSFVAAEEAHCIELTRAALAPFAIDRDLIRIVAALLDIEVYRGLQRAGLSLDQAAQAIAEVIEARITRKD